MDRAPWDWRRGCTGSGNRRPTGRNPVEILQAQAATREQDLVPIRYGWMLSSPFAFFPDGNDDYFRQLWDMGGGIDPARPTPGGLGVYGGLGRLLYRQRQ
jgi:hypothetical protein